MRNLTIDELEILTQDQLWELFHHAIRRYSSDYPPQVQHIKDLIISGCPIGPRDKGGLTALHYAVLYNYSEIVKFLISLGAEVNARAGSRDWTAWDIANDKIKELCPELEPK